MTDNTDRRGRIRRTIHVDPLTSDLLDRMCKSQHWTLSTVVIDMTRRRAKQLRLLKTPAAVQPQASGEPV